MVQIFAHFNYTLNFCTCILFKLASCLIESDVIMYKNLQNNADRLPVSCFHNFLPLDKTFLGLCMATLLNCWHRRIILSDKATMTVTMTL